VATTKVLDWLLEEEQPAARYLTLRDLLDRSGSDPDVRGAKHALADRGWAAEILAARQPGGWWVTDKRLYQPKYLSTNWQLLMLSDLGVTREVPAVRESAELWIERFAKTDGGFGIDGNAKSHLCTNGNTARALVKFGYADHPAVRSSFEWLVEHASHLGGWSCWGSGRNLDSWEGLSAFAVYPRKQWTPEMTHVVEQGAEFFLERELYRQGAPYEPWNRFHFPAHYYYDLLIGLDILTALGYGADPRLDHALKVLRKRRRADGRWNLDALHPDVEGGIAEWFAKHPKDRPTPVGIETPGRPSKMITLAALRVLKRVEEAR
jgi:hypothetical protein